MTSSWTVDTLKDYLEAVIGGNDKLYGERFESQKIAVLKQEAANEKRLDSMNEFRATLKDQQVTLLPRSEAELSNANLVRQLDAITVEVNSLRESRGASAGSADQTKSLWGYAIGFIGVAISLVLLALRLAGK